MRRLASLDEPSLYGRLVDLRKQVADWLAYTPQTFPHYTRHTIVHSEEIVVQLSRLLFEAGDPDRPALDLAAAELFCLVAAALLHDAGMVTSERERLEILRSAEWRDWVEGGTGARRWRELEQLRTAASTPEQHFVVDLQLRFLLADFVRRRHHVRSGEFITHSETLFRDLSFGDAALTRTVADVCEAHGLDWAALNDSERFPTLRDVAGGPVNVRLVAVLLRLGDLLDLSHDRACPLLLTAAAPIPADSLAHWTQYQRIVHRSTAPDRVEITAECHDQQEHRVLADWCKWIEQEVDRAPSLLVGSRRHASWRPPLARMSGAEPTMRVRPAPGASYIPVDWTFEIDPETVFDRFVKDVYTDSLDFLRELLQNAADANRCAAPDTERQSDGWPWGERTSEPTILVTISSTERIDDMSGEKEVRTCIAVEDEGVGMTADAIRNYLLQVGRSYYQSTEFRRKHGFVPTSRFGVGFLSVFSVSSDVTIDTLPMEVDGAPQPLRVKLSGPRSYVLLERGQRTRHGTRVAVGLTEDIRFSDVVAKLVDWCRRLEFPVVVRDERTGEETTVERELADAYEYDIEIETATFDRARRRAVRLEAHGLRGEWYVEEVREKHSQEWRWDVHPGMVEDQIVKANPLALKLPPELPTLLCLHGFNVMPSGVGPERPMIRVDYRKPQDELPLSLDRRSWRGHDLPPPDEAVTTTLLDALEEHFTSRDADWWYRARTLSNRRLPRNVTYHVPGSVRLFDADGTPQFLSLAEAAKQPNIWIVPDDGLVGGRLQDRPNSMAADDLALSKGDADEWNTSARLEILQSIRTPSVVDVTAHGHYCVLLSATPGRASLVDTAMLVSEVEGAEDSHLVVPIWSDFTRTTMCWINARNPVFRWLSRFDEFAGPVPRREWVRSFGLAPADTVSERIVGSLLHAASGAGFGDPLEVFEALVRALWRDGPANAPLPVEIAVSDIEIGAGRIVTGRLVGAG